MSKLFTLILVIATCSSLSAQSVDEIITAYYNAIGGANWEKVNSLTLKANVEQGGMKIPIEVVSMRDGRNYTEITLMGNKMIMQGFDGKTNWSTNFMTMEAEKSSSEVSENAIRSKDEFPYAILVYKKLGYTPTLLGTETVDGTPCHKIKLEKKTRMVEGVETPNIEYIYIDKESNVAIMTESEIMEGEMKGKIGQNKMSDYQEVNGVFIPFSNSQGIKGEEFQTMQFESITVNDKVDETKFAFPKK
ncbi:MAG: outer membrane lipoprotein-sorting protein [Flavobacteriia bacterium]|nr:outer membrane lipoprotein-sorting protein [Flavobacteriia bacterium]